ncbi:MAG: type II toxin-antitoxin system HicB family antitoxin [Planctomycetota bacterium]
MRYATVIEKACDSFSAYVPDLPGCVATGDTVDEARAAIREAIAFHLDGMREDGEAIPEPTAVAEFVETDAA